MPTTFPEAQADMRSAYLAGAPGVFASALAWIAAAAVAMTVSTKAATYTLLIAGAFIFPVGVILAKALGAAGKHQSGNPLGTLAMEGTFWMLAGIAVAYGVSLVKPEWFFVAMLFVIGGRYLTFQTLYGLKIYWLLGAVLCAAALAGVFLRLPAAVCAAAGALIEVVFAVILLRAAKAPGASPVSA